MNYGLPYMGSKSKICKEVCSRFPRAKHFYDLFGGGFSITHFMRTHRSRHYEHFHFNEIRPGICELIKDAIAGKYNYKTYKPEWVSREEFFQRKDHDPLIKILWSFGNNGKDYLFGEDIEAYKKSMHMAVVFNEFDATAKKIFGCDKFADGFDINERRLYLRSRQSFLGEKQEQLQQLQQLERLERLQQLERLERLQQLERLERLTFSSLSYELVEIRPDSVVYCDIPYRGTGEYDKSFDHDKFYNWAASQSEPVFVSEYSLPDNRFKCVANFEKRSMLSPNKEKTLMKTEKVFVNQAGYRKLMGGR